MAVAAKKDMYICFLPQDWESIRCPVLVMHREDEKLIHTSKGSSLYNTFYRDRGDPMCAFVAVKDAGHQLMQEKPAEVLDSIVDFMDECLCIPSGNRI